MKLLKTLIATTVVLLVQTMLLNGYPGIRLIDLFLLMNVYYALNFTQLSGIALSLCSGLIQDSFSKGILGMNAFSKTVVSYLISSLSSRLMIKHPLIIMLLVSVSTVVDFLIIRGLHRLFGLPQFPISYQALSVASILNGFTGMVGFQIADKIRLRKEYD